MAGNNKEELGAALVALGDRLSAELFSLGAKLMYCDGPTCVAEVVEELRRAEEELRRARRQVEELLS